MSTMKITTEHLNHVRAFTQHGFVPTEITGDELIGSCLFCGKTKLYVNYKSHAWDCKTCGKSGGFQGWLRTQVDWTQQEFNGASAIQLRKNRGLKIESLRWGRVGYNPLTRAYSIPIWDRKRKQLHDVRRYNGKGMRSTSTCKAGLFGMDYLRENTIIWLMEGEWDGLTMHEILSVVGHASADVLAVPGGLTFKAEWIPFFEGRTIHVCYDNDNTGQRGAIKVFNALQSVAKELKFLHWPAKTPDKFDIRDLYHQYKCHAADTFTAITNFLNTLPQQATETTSGININTHIEFTGEGISPEKVRATYQEDLYIADTDTIDVLYGTILANRLPGEPIWLFYVAPSGMTKTEYLQSFASAPEIVSVSTLTPHALVSGANTSAGDPSLIPKLHNRTLIIKDFTTILNLPQIAREEIFGVLRDAFDGTIVKSFGNGVHRRYTSKFGILAGVTPAIDAFLEGESALGERFLRWRVDLPSRIDEHMKYLQQATSNVTKEAEIRSRLLKLSEEALAYDYQDTMKIPEKILKKLLYLSIWVSLMRGTVIRDKYSKEVTFQPFRELGTRLSKQFVKLAKGIGMFRRVTQMDEDLYRIIRKLALGTVEARVVRIMNAAMCLEQVSFSPKDISLQVSLPMGTTQRLMENLALLGAFQKTRLSSLKTEWCVTPEFRDLTIRAGMINE